MSVSSPAAARPANRVISTAVPGSEQGRRNLVLAVVLVSQLMVVLDVTIVNIALPHIKSALHFSTANLSWVIDAYTLTFGGLLLLGARAGDLLGRRRTFLIGIAIFTAASLLGGLATSSGLLLAARAVQGIGGALVSPSALALLMTMFPEGRERTRAIGYYTAVSIGGSAIGLVAGGMLTEWASWRWVLFVNVPIGLAVIPVARVTLPETLRSTGRFDILGAVTSTGGMAAVVYGFIHAATAGWSHTATVIPFVVGVALLAAFVFVERTAAAPITPLRLFASRNRSIAYVGRLLMVAGMLGMFFFLTQFLQGVLGYSPVKTGFAFLPLTIALFASSQLTARVLVEKINQRTLMLVGLTMSTLGLLWLTQLGEHSGYGSLLGPLLLFGIGNGLAFIPLTTLALAGVEPKDAGAASGLVNVMQQVGGSLGLAVLVTIFGSASRHAAAHPQAGTTAAQQATHAFIVGADHGFVAATLFLAATLVLLAVVVRTPKLPDIATEPIELAEV